MKDNSYYTTLTEANFRKEVLENPEPVMVEFGAEWCGTCHIIAPIIEELVADFEGLVKVGKLDVDDNKQIAQEYGILELPTLLFFKNGNVVDHIVRAVPKNIIAKKIKTLLKAENKKSKLSNGGPQPKV